MVMEKVEEVKHHHIGARATNCRVCHNNVTLRPQSCCHALPGCSFNLLPLRGSASFAYGSCTSSRRRILTESFLRAPFQQYFLFLRLNPENHIHKTKGHGKLIVVFQNNDECDARFIRVVSLGDGGNFTVSRMKIDGTTIAEITDSRSIRSWNPLP